jgi:hypothetical protein
MKKAWGGGSGNTCGGGDEHRDQQRGRVGVLEHPEGGRGHLPSRLPPLHLPSRRAARQPQDQEEPGAQWQARGGIADVVQEIRPVGRRHLAHALGQGAARLRPEGRPPQRQPIPYQEPGDRLLLPLGNLRQRLLAPGHLVGDATLEVEHGNALRLQGRLGCGKGGKGGVDLLEDRLGRLLRSSAGGGPGRVQSSQAVQCLLQAGGPLR